MKIIRYTQFVSVLAIAVLIALNFACDSETPQMESFSGEITIGAVHPITGRLSLENPPLGQGFELAVSEINNSQRNNIKIELIVEDGQSSVEGAM